jgi:hypothetical protein
MSGRQILAAGLLAGLVVHATASAEGRIGIGLSQDAVAVSYTTETRQPEPEARTDWLIGGWFTEDNDFIGRTGLMVTRDVDERLSFGIGAEAYGIFWNRPDELGDEGIGAIGLGGRIRYRASGLAIPVGMEASGIYAPEIATLGDADALFRWSFRVTAEVTRQSFFFVGYQRLAIDPPRGGQVRFENAPRFGVQLAF